jgi:transcriptional regulator with XRE-family HTH domain
MNVKKKRTYSHYTRNAAALLGKSIKLARKARRLTTSDFAARVGISRVTLQKIEKGDLKCEVGIVFEAAILESVNDKLALLPKSIRKSKQEIDDDF